MAQIKIRLLVAPILVFGGLWLHEIIQALAGPALHIDTALDLAIPFIPWTVWIYFSFFVFIGSTVFRVDERVFWRFVIASSLAAAIAWSIVLLFPVTFDRPDPLLISNEVHRHIFVFVHAADPHHISFPSLHVAVTWICNFVLWNRRGRALRVALGIGISLSTLFTKQHLIADVVGGVLLALFCVWGVGRVSRRREAA